jgi:hypothetical protein
MSLDKQELVAFNFEDRDSDIENELEKRKNNLDEDNRPSIPSDYSLIHNKELSKNIEDVVIKRLKKNVEEKELDRKTIMDMKLKDIISKTTKTTADFLMDYNIKLIEAKHHYEKRYELTSNTMGISDFFTIHSLAFVEYMKDGDNTLYLGILFVIISVIIYLFI